MNPSKRTLALVLGALLAVLTAVVWSAKETIGMSVRSAGQAVGRVPVAAPVLAEIPEGSFRSEESARSEVAGEPVLPVQASVADAQEPELILIGHCVDPHGQGLEGVEVTAKLQEAVTAWSRMDGSFELRTPWPEEWSPGKTRWIQLGFSKAGWTRAREYPQVSKPSVLDLGRLVMEPAGGVFGRVVDAAGRGVPDAKISLVGGTEAGSAAVEESRRILGIPFPSSGSWDQVSTDAEGFYRFETAPVGRLSVVARLELHYAAYSSPFELQRGASYQVSAIVLEPVANRHRIGGHLHDQEGPVALAQVRFCEEGEPRNGPYTYRQTDALGKFAVAVLPGKSYRVEVVHPDLPGFEIILEGVQPGETSLELRFPEGRWVEIEARDVSGSLLQSWVTLYSRERRRTSTPDQEQGPEGRTQFLVPNGSFDLTVGAYGYLSKQVGSFDSTTIPETIDVELERAASLSGSVLCQGVPQTDVEIHFHSRPPDSEASRSARRKRARVRQPRSHTDQAGHFEMFVSQAQTYLIRAFHEEKGFAELEVPFDGERSVSNLQLELRPCGALTGSVLTGSEISPGSIIVGATRAGGPSRATTARPDGTYRLEGLPPGAWHVGLLTKEQRRRVERESSFEFFLEEELEYPVTVLSGETSRYDLDLGLLSFCSLRGNVGEELAKLGRWAVTLLVVEDGEYFRTGTLPSGEFQLDQVLGSGQAYLTVSMLDQHGQTRSISFQIELVGALVQAPTLSTFGSVRLSGLGSSASSTPSYALVSPRSSQPSWYVVFEPNADGEWASAAIPSGRAEIRRRGTSLQASYPVNWEKIGEIDVQEGAETSLRLVR